MALSKSDKARKGFFSRKYLKIKKKLSPYYRAWFLGDVFPFEVKRWFRDNGDNTLRLNYKLDENSVVFDVGGYLGDFADQISSRYRCYVHVFEPNKEFYENCLVRFSLNPKIKCHNFGLADVDGYFSLSDNADASSIKPERSSEQANTVQVRRFSDVYDEIGVQRIDLLKINIEGGEYDLLPHIMNKNIVENIDNIQVQFHDFIENAPRLRLDIIERLKLTHTCDWCYTFVWENWSISK